MVSYGQWFCRAMVLHGLQTGNGFTLRKYNYNLQILDFLSEIPDKKSPECISKIQLGARLQNFLRLKYVILLDLNNVYMQESRPSDTYLLRFFRFAEKSENLVNIRKKSKSANRRKKDWNIFHLQRREPVFSEHFNGAKGLIE